MFEKAVFFQLRKEIKLQNNTHVVRGFPLAIAGRN